MQKFIQRKDNIVEKTVQQRPLKEILNGVTFVSIIMFALFYIPVLGKPSLCFLPLPIIYYRLKFGRKPMMILMTLTMLIAIQSDGGLSIKTLLIAELLVLGSVMSEFILKKLSADEIILYTTGILFFAGFFGLLYYSQMISTGIGKILTDNIEYYVTMTMNVFRELGMPDDQLEQIAQSYNTNIFILMPSISITFLMIVTWLNLLAARVTFPNFELSFPDFGSLNYWKSPEVLIWGVIGAGSITLFPSEPLRILGMNVLIVLMDIYFFQGIAVVSYFFETKNVSRSSRILLYSFIIVQPLSILLIIGIGVFDVWADFRKQSSKNEQPPDIHSGFPYDWF
jgi:uncharacterized protein YybS (DUF2232 family)